MYVASGIEMPLESYQSSSLKIWLGAWTPTIRNREPSTVMSRPTGSAPPKSLEPSVPPTTATVERRRSSSSVRPRPIAICRFIQRP